MSQVVFITCGVKGIGLAIARQISESGHVVYGTNRNPQQATVRGIHLLPLEFRATKLLSGWSIRSSMKPGRLIFSIHNAGYGLYVAAEDTTIEELHAQMDANICGAIFVM